MQPDAPPSSLDVSGVDLGQFSLSRSVLDNSPIGMVITSPDERVLWSSAAMDALAGPWPERRPDQDLLAFVDADDRATLRDDARRLVAGEGAPPRRECRWVAPDGSVRWVSVRASLALDASGEPLLQGDPPQACVIRQVLDVTERKTAEAELAEVLAQLRARNAELERSNEELTQFAYVASHDLSEPLRVIAGHVDLLARRYAGRLDEDADRYIAFAVDGCTRMRALIDDLLRYSRAGRELQLQPVALAEVVERVRLDLTHALEDVGGSVVVDGELPTVVADRSQLQQVVTNLVSNALKYRRPEEPPAVRVSARRLPGAWQLLVDDNGIGVPAAQRHRIFRIFQRLHGRDVPGTGIGLAVCRKVVEQHGGTVEVEDAPTGGARFVVTLPEPEAPSRDTMNA